MFSNEQISKAYQGIKDHIVETPCLFSPQLSALASAKVFLKLESMQRTGSFKERGAVNFLLNQGSKITHVVAASAGNHAQAVALHASRQKIKATIFMPKGTPNTKIIRTQSFHAQVEIVGNNYDEAFLAASDYAKAERAHYLHAYDDLDVICGQATVGLEIMAQVGKPDAIFVPVGGGGLISGIGKFFSNMFGPHGPKIFGVEVSQYQSMAMALNGNAPKITNGPTIADGIAVKKIGRLTKEICEEINPQMLIVDDLQIQNAIMLLLEQQKIVTEGAAASVVAALMSREFMRDLASKTIVLVISGGNIDTGLLARLSQTELINSGRLCQMSVVINDTPGSLAGLLNIICLVQGNIIGIQHERSFAKLRWNEVMVNLTVETRDEAHEEEMLAVLQAKGFSINRYQLE